MNGSKNLFFVGARSASPEAGQARSLQSSLQETVKLDWHLVIYEAVFTANAARFLR